MTLSMGGARASGVPNVGKDRGTRGAERGGSRSTRECRTVEAAHGVPYTGGRSTCGCRTEETEAHAGAKKKHWVPGERRTEAHAGAKLVRGC